MKKILKFVLMFSLMFCISIFISAKEYESSEDSGSKEQINKYKKESIKQTEEMETFKNKLEEEQLTLDDVKEQGVIFYDEDNNLQIKFTKKAKDLNKQNKIKSVHSKVSMKGKGVTESVLYSEQELELIVKNWYKDNQDINFTENTLIKYDYITNQVELKTDQLTDENQKIITQRYGDKIRINIDPTYKAPVSTKGREENWNKLGGRYWYTS